MWSSGIREGFGIAGCNEPTGCIWALIALKSWIKCHLPDFGGIIKMGVFHGLEGDSLCPASNYSLTNCSICPISSLVIGNCSIQTGARQGRGCSSSIQMICNGI